MAARQRIFSDASSSHALVTYAHARFPGWGCISGDNGRWRWRGSLGVT